MNDNNIELKRNISEDIKKYLLNLPEEILPSLVKEEASVLLSGSMGYKPAEALRRSADWDIHIVINNERYKKIVARFGEDYVVDDHDHEPIVFCSVHS